MSNLNLYGIDVSEWNGEIDWKEVAKTKKFAIIRAGFGEPTPDQIDSSAVFNVTNALSNGMKVGLYWFSYPRGDSEKPKREAQGIIDFAKRFPGRIALPLWYDLEGGEEGTQTREFVRTCAVNFCETVKAAGGIPGIYYNFDYDNRYYGEDFWLSHPDYKRWLAFPDSGSPGAPYDVWQYSFVGKVPGITGDVDLDILTQDEPPHPHPDPKLPPWLIWMLKKAMHDWRLAQK